MKAKIGQILYNNYITDRLREEVLQRVAHRNSLALRMSLGKDPSGEEVFLDILVNRIRPEVEELKRSVSSSEPRSGDLKKFTCIILSSDTVQSNDNMGIASNFEYLMSQSLNWWARYSGSRDTLNVDKWKIEHALTVDSKNANLALEVPIENIIVPDSRKYEWSEGISSPQFLETLPPVAVRVRDKGRFELISGYHILEAYIRGGKREIPVLVRNVSDEEADRLFEESKRSWERVALRAK
jgi:hypothetical protein